MVDEAADGVSALGLLAQNRYGVVLLDLMMPHVDGFAVLEAIHADAAGDPPVVIVVSGADRATLDLLDPERIHGVIRKPFDPLEIGEVVAACIEIRGRNSLGTMALATALATAPLLAMMRW